MSTARKLDVERDRVSGRWPAPWSERTRAERIIEDFVIPLGIVALAGLALAAWAGWLDGVGARVFGE